MCLKRRYDILGSRRTPGGHHGQRDGRPRTVEGGKGGELVGKARRRGGEGQRVEVAMFASCLFDGSRERSSNGLVANFGKMTS